MKKTTIKKTKQIMAKTETRVKVVFTKAGEAYSATQAYRLHDYIVLNGVTIYACKKVDPATMTCVGHPLTDTAYWDKFLDMAELKAASENATSAANAAAKSATDAASAANTAKTNADKATEAANTAASAANTAKTNADTATTAANTAAAGAEKVNATITADNVLKVTDRTGAEKTLELMEQAESATIKTELAGKFDKDSIVQELGEAEDKVISQKVVTSYINTVMSKTNFMAAVSSGFFHTNLCNQNDSDFTDGYFITHTGDLQAQELTVVTGYIPFIKEMESLVCSIDGNLNSWSNIYIALYDINKKFISAKPANKNVVWQEGVAFARFSLQKSSTGLSHYQVEVGTEPTPYIEYGKADIKDIVKVTEKNIATGSVTSEKIATGSVTSEKIATGSVDVSKVNFFHTNLCNQNDSDFTDGYFITHTGDLQAQELTVVTGYIPFIKEMESLVCSIDGNLNSWSNIYIALYDINKKFISAKPANKNVVWQEGVAFARFSLQKSSTGLSHYQVEVGTEPTPYIEYGKADIKDIVKVTEKNIATGSVTSEKIATGSVTSEKIATGLIRKRIQINTSDSEIEILLKMKKAFDEGNYDVYWEHGTYTFSSVYQYMIDTLKWSWTMGLPIGNNCRYYFNGSTLISNDPSDEYSESRNILDCKASSQNYELHDGILINNGGTYCVHDEGNRAEGFYRHVYDNMQMKYVKGSKTQYLSKCIGGGMGLNGLVLINRCIFDTNATAQDTSWHGALHSEEKVNFKIVMTNCYFSKQGISLDSTFKDGDSVILEFANNSIEKGEIMSKNATLYKFNNEIRNRT